MIWHKSQCFWSLPANCWQDAAQPRRPGLPWQTVWTKEGSCILLLPVESSLVAKISIWERRRCGDINRVVTWPGLLSGRVRTRVSRVLRRSRSRSYHCATTIAQSKLRGILYKKKAASSFVILRQSRERLASTSVDIDRGVTWPLLAHGRVLRALPSNVARRRPVMGSPQARDGPCQGPMIFNNCKIQLLGESSPKHKKAEAVQKHCERYTNDTFLPLLLC